jgi:hypothetical protein
MLSDPLPIPEDTPKKYAIRPDHIAQARSRAEELLKQLA